MPAAVCSSSGRGFAPPSRRTNRPHKDRHLSKLLQLAIAIRQIEIIYYGDFKQHAHGKEMVYRGQALAGLPLVNGLNRGKPQILRKLLHGNPLIYADCPDAFPGGGEVDDRVRGKPHRRFTEHNRMTSLGISGTDRIDRICCLRVEKRVM